MRRKQSTWKRTAGLGIFLLLAGILSGCGGGEKGPTEIVLWEMMDPQERVILDELLEEYNQANPDVRVTHTNYGNEQLRTQFLTAVLGGGGPDFVFGPSDIAGVFSVAGAVTPIDEAFPPEFLTEFVEIAFDTLGGHKWMLPSQVGNHLCFVYNRAMIPEPPKTLAEMVRMAKEQTKDTNGDGSNDQYGLVFDMKEPFWLVPFLGAFGGWVMDSDNNPTLDTPAMVDALRFMYKMKTEDRVMPRECTYELSDTIFKEKKAAMTINGPWSWNAYTDAGIDLGLASLPKCEETGLWCTPMISSRGYFLNVNLSGDRKEMTLDVIRFLTSREAQIEFAKRLSVIPSRKDAIEDPEIQKMEQIVASWEQYKLGKRMPVVAEMRAIWDAMRPAFQNVLNGDTTPEDAAKSMQADAEKKISEMKG